MYFTLFIFGSFLVFVTSQRTFLHFSRTARRIFWYCLSVAVGIWLVQWLQTVEGVGMVWVILSAVLAASVVEDEMSKKTGLTPLNIEATQRLRAAYRTPEAQGKAEKVMDVIATITRGKGYTAGTKQLLERATGATQRYQEMLHDVLKTATGPELNYILCAVNAAAMVEVAHTSTITMLTGKRLHDLSVVARAALVDGLQKLGLRYRYQRQLWVKDVMLGTTGIDLTHFKAYIDDGGDYHSMYKLIHNDLQGQIQHRVLRHIKQQGQEVKKQFEKLVPGGPPGVVLKIMSDIDDTLFSSGASFPAGVDNLYPRKCYYPGALALYSELDRCFAKHYGHQIAALSEPSPPAVVDRGKDETEDDDSLSSPFARQLSNQGGSSLTVNTSQLDTPITSAGMAKLPGDMLSPREVAGFANTGMTSPRKEALAEAAAVSTAPHIHHQEGANLVFLSARPQSYKGMTESESYRKYFQPLVARGELDTCPTMLLGSLNSGPKALYRLFKGKFASAESKLFGRKPDTAVIALYQTLAAKKMSRFNEYADIYPEAAFVLVGDNGQGDVLCAELLWSSMKTKSGGKATPLLASFVHKVVPVASTLSMLHTSKGTQEDWLASWKERGLYFHRTHVGMAVEALSLGLLDAESLHRVTVAARNDFRRIFARYGERHGGRNLSKALYFLNGDIAEANELLPRKLHVPVLRIDGLDCGSLQEISRLSKLPREPTPSDVLSDVSLAAAHASTT